MIDGCNRWQVFTKVILPLVAPGLIATGGLMAAAALTSLSVVVLFVVYQSRISVG